MKTQLINLVMLKPFTTNDPGVFDDTVYPVQHHLKRAGFNVHVTCNTMCNEALNIVWGPGAIGRMPLEQLRQFIKPEYSVIFNMEQINSGSRLVTDEYLEFLSEYRVLDYNQHNVAALRARFPSIRCQEFPLLPAPSFAGDFTADWTQTGPRADVSFWGARNDRRQVLLDTLQRRGRDVQIVSGRYGKHLSAAVAHTKLCLNAHYYQSGIFELARCLRPLAMGVPIISEMSRLPSLVDWRQSGIFFRDYDTLAASCEELLDNPELLHHSVRKTQHFLNNPDWQELTRLAMLAILN
jgi:hypothetical protein